MRTVAALLLATCAAISSAKFQELKPEEIRQSTIDNFPKLFSLKVCFTCFLRVMLLDIPAKFPHRVPRSAC